MKNSVPKTQANISQETETPVELTQEEVFPESSEQLYKTFHKNKVNQRAINRYKDKPYLEAYKSKRLLATIGSFLMQIMGGLLAVFAVNRLLSYLFPAFPYVEILTISLAVLLLALLEFGKRILWNELFSEYYRKNAVSMASLLISLVLFGVSAGSSTVGAYQLTTAMMDSTEKIEQQSLVNVTTVEKNYDAQIAEYRNKIKQIEQEVNAKIRKGYYLSTPPVDAKKIDFYSSQIEKLQAERDKRAGRIETGTEKQTLGIKETAEKYAMAGFGLSLLFEILAVACIGYLAFFDFRVFIEAMAAENIDKKAKKPEIIRLEDLETPQGELIKLFLQVSKLPPQLKNALLEPVVNKTTTFSPQPSSEQIGFQVIKNTPAPNQQLKNQPAVTKTNAGQASEAKTYKIKCKNCGKHSEKKSPNALYCSDTCRKEFAKKKKK